MNRVLIVKLNKEKLHDYEFVKPIVDIVKGNKLDFLVKDYRKVNSLDLKNCSKVIICGTSLADFEYLMNIKNFEWIKDFDKPLFGICAGSQILVTLFGGRLFERGKKTLSRAEIGFVTCNFKKDFFGFKGNYSVYGLHQLGFGIGGKKSILEPYAFSNKGLQAFKHKERSFYGALFHPEVRNKEIIVNFLKN